jgi:hypothetical protein
MAAAVSSLYNNSIGILGSFPDIGFDMMVGIKNAYKKNKKNRKKNNRINSNNKHLTTPKVKHQKPKSKKKTKP